MGLTVNRGILEIHGDTLWADRNIPAGAIFILPSTQSEAAGRQRNTPAIFTADPLQCAIL